MAKYLDSTGVSTLWTKIKDTFVKKADIDNTFVEVVSILPGKEGGADASTIGKHLYLIKSSTSTTALDKFDEYIYTGTLPISETSPYVDNAWELLGSFEASVDLSDYAKKSEALGNLVTAQDATKATLHKSTVSGSMSDVCITSATSSAAGVMSAADKTKLDGIATGANNYSLPTASASTLGGIKVGNNLSITDGVLASKDTTYSIATTTEAGLMSASDRSMMNYATDFFDHYVAYTLPIATSTTLGGVKSTTTGTTAGRDYNIEINTDGTMKVNVPWVNTNTTYSNATTSIAGLMSTTDKSKLDGIASSATSDSALSVSEVSALLT